MTVYKAPLNDYKFLFHEVFNVTDVCKRLGYDQVDRELLDMMSEEWSQFVIDVWKPSNTDGDQIGSKLEEGSVISPPGFKEAWKKTVESGWLQAVCKEEHGGMELPLFFRNAMDEPAISCNMAISVVAALSLGVYDLIIGHGSQKIIDRYAARIGSGEWCGTMCLTEPHCGTDLGMVKTKAIPQEDGSYSITGTKIFITAGDHDLSDNIVHMVLAKLPDAPKGSKGISLFLVPKYLDEGDGISDEINGTSISGLEDKMGLHGSPTCVLNFDLSKGWLMGEPHTGMAQMFEMMNRERLATGMMGLGLGEIAYQNALAWSLERRQGRDLRGIKDLNSPADNILVHPDVRRMLLKAKVNCEGTRALGTWIGILLDEMKMGDEETSRKASALIALLTPVMKAYSTDIGCQSASLSMQVMGGAGYCSEYGVEQFYRDVRIAPIWEGTNGIQALDLVGRKVTQNFGRNLRDLMWPLLDFIKDNREIDDMAEFNKPLHQSVKGLQQLTLMLMAEGAGNPHFLAAGATDYCTYFGNTVLAYLWAKMAKVCLAAKLAGTATDFHEAKLASARVFFAEIYPDNAGLAAKILAGHKHLMSYPEAAF
ncbi:MAG TPA: acyl-CoA dehydrogenase C-terminal domain-containing protein [Candidatus Thalassarchaeaceae archaeon]|nr:acyl-CoA dehydrogenase C-terminal domain-containing protein [Candidatus Thalassarchaeaceae archaeon]